MTLIKNKKVAFLLGGVVLATCLDAAAVPFYSRQNRGAQAQAQSESGQSGLMTGYTQDVQSGLSDFQFLARNFSGSNSGPGKGVSVTGNLGGTPTTSNDDTDNNAPLPGSLALFGLGVSLMAWVRRK